MKKTKKEEPKPIIEMNEEKSMPLFIFIGNTKCPWLENTEMNLMMTAMHMKKENKIEVRGRMRYEATGNKTAFEMKESFKMTELLEAKQKIREMYNKVCEEMKLEETRPPYELEFMIGEKTEDIIQKMQDSDQFNIQKLAK